MGFFLYPGEYLSSTYRIDFDKLYDEGYRGVIFDIDNTLVPHGAPADEQAIALFAHLRELGFQCLVLSNNKEPRVKLFAEAAAVRYIYKAGKPKPSAYRRAMRALGTDKSNTLFVGDQIFTDVCGANLAGIRTILVKPIHPKEEIQIVLKRYLEKVVLLCYRIHVKLFGNTYPSSEKDGLHKEESGDENRNRK
ncbi:MAG: YqeG family HAD IIIA-type phosphatase [Agathobacter sp.]|nr:YqeG family HAD IIIA-type phosphatase [Agathobacter sp.]